MTSSSSSSSSAPSPSLNNHDGMPPIEVYQATLLSCRFIKKVCLRLKLNLMATCTAQVFFHRFFARQSMAGHDKFVVAITCVFLGAKVEESFQRLEEVLKASLFVLSTPEFSGFNNNPPSSYAASSSSSSSSSSLGVNAAPTSSSSSSSTSRYLTTGGESTTTSPPLTTMGDEKTRTTPIASSTATPSFGTSSSASTSDSSLPPGGNNATTTTSGATAARPPSSFPDQQRNPVPTATSQASSSSSLNPTSSVQAALTTTTTTTNAAILLSPAEIDRERLREKVLVCERIVLHTMSFDIMVEHAHPLVEKMMSLIIPSGSETTKNMVFNVLNDALSTNACLRYPPRLLAAGAICLACTFLKSVPGGSNNASSSASTGGMSAANRKFMLDNLANMFKRNDVFGFSAEVVMGVEEELVAFYEDYLRAFYSSSSSTDGAKSSSNNNGGEDAMTKRMRPTTTI